MVQTMRAACVKALWLEGAKPVSGQKESQKDWGREGDGEACVRRGGGWGKAGARSRRRVGCGQFCHDMFCLVFQSPW